MGFLSGLFGGGGPELDPIDPEQTLSDTKSYWESYNTYLNDAKADYDKQISGLDQKLRLGTIHQSQYDAATAEIKQGYDATVEGIKTGPTADILKEEYDFQKQTAQAKYDAQYPEPDSLWDREGGYIGPETSTGDREGGGGEYTGPPAGYTEVTDREGGSTWEADPTYDPYPGKEPFTFSPTLEEFFTTEFGDSSSTSPGAVASISASARLRGSGAGAGSTVGVGNVYSFY